MTIARDRWLAIAILLVAAVLRIHALSYGLDYICLTPPEEHWLYETYQPTSLYRWNVAPQGAFYNLPGRVQSTPLATIETPALDRFALRLASLALGLIALAIILHLGRRLRTNWWALGGLLVAVGPWFVAADRWTLRFDGGSFAVAVSLLALRESYRLSAGWRRDLAVGIQSCAALSLLVIVPPLWWLTIALLLIQPYRRWRLTLFFFLAGLVLIPGLQTPELWLAAAQDWDTSVTAACIFVGLALALWWRQRLARGEKAIFLLAIMMLGAITLYQDFQLVQPSPDERQLIDWLQTRIPDDSVVRFDSATWRLASVVACPLGANLHFDAQSMPVPFFDARVLAEPYYFVSAGADAVAEMPYISSIDTHYWIGRGLKLDHAVDISFGDLVYLLGYDVLTPTVSPSEAVDIRIDYQFGAHMTPDVLAYAAFVHLTPTDDPTTNSANISDRFFEESGNTGSRRVMLNHHIRFTLPPEMPSGSYDVRYGVYNQYSGAAVGDAVVLGKIIVQ